MKIYKWIRHAGILYLMLCVSGFSTARDRDITHEMHLKAVRISQWIMKDKAPARMENVRFVRARSEEDAGAITGVVLTEDGKPISMANITAWTEEFGASLMGFAITDAEGHYIIEKLSTGKYFVSADAPDFFPEFYDNVFYIEEATSVLVAGSDTVRNVDFSLGPMTSATGAIAGNVSDQDGLPITFASVNTFSLSNPFLYGWSETDSAGNYLIPNLGSGEYYVSVWAEGYITEYFDDARTFDSAQVVLVAEPQTTDNIDFMLSPGAIISGIVTNDEGKPVPYAYIEAIDEAYSDSLKSDRWGFAESDSSGYYEITGITTGTYLVLAQAWNLWQSAMEWYDNADTPEEATPVPAVEGQITPNIDFSLSLTFASGSVSGYVYDTNGAALQNIFIMAEMVSSDYSWAISGMGVTDENGHFRIEGLPAGQYIVSAQRWEDWYFVERWYNNVESREDATEVTVVDGQETTGINFVMQEVPKGLGSISGRVTTDEGKPLYGVYVQAVSENGKSPVWWGSLYAYTDSLGNYRIEDLPAGTYYISALFWDYRTYVEQWYDGASCREEAALVAVVDTMDTPDIHFVLTIKPAFGYITGTVKSDADSSPVPYASVEAYQDNRDYSDPGSGFDTFGYNSAMTDMNGNYVLSYLPEGAYYVTVIASGVREYYNDASTVLDANLVPVTAGDTTAGIDFGLPAPQDTGSSIAGVVTDDSTGLHVRWAVVQAFPEWVLYTMRPVNWLDPGIYHITVSDSLGQYHLYALPEGKYYVQCWVDGYIGEFYDNVFDPSQAMLVEVDGKNEVGNIDFALQSGWYCLDVWEAMKNGGGAGIISGMVRDGNDAPIEGAYLYALDSEQQAIAFARSQVDGGYQITGLPEGEFYIQASRVPYQGEYFDNAIGIGQATVVILGGGNGLAINGIDFTLDPAQNTRIEDDKRISMPAVFALYQNHPNPFNSTTVFRYDVPASGVVTLEIRNLLGQKIRTLVNEWKTAGNYEVSWQGIDESGVALPSGIYFCCMKAAGWQSVRKISLLR